MSEQAIRLLVVDDEPLARMRIRTFDLAARGYIVAGEAENGEQAWRMIGELQPDIVIADIGMPVLDGLGLLTRIRRMAAPPVVILLTCFEDFDKVQYALRHGASDYLTKLLLSEEELVASLDQAAAELRRKRQQKQWSDRQLLHELLLADSEPEAAALAGELTGFRQFRLGLLRFPAGSEVPASHLAGAYELEAAPYAARAVRLEEPLWALVLASAEPNGAAAFNAWAADRLSRGYDACASAGVLPLQALSDVVYTASRLPAALAECRRLLAQAFYAPPGIVVTDDAAGFEAVEAAASEERLEAVHADIRKAAEEEDAGALAKALSAWREEVAGHLKPGPERLKHAAFELGGCFPEHAALETEEGDAAVGAWLADAIAEVGHAGELAGMLERLQRGLKRRPANFRLEIREAIAYIRSHYREDLDLATVARHVNLSPSWFGTLFRNETGIGFMDYLQNYRLEQARSLMTKSDLKIYEISELVGIGNPRYFSRLFSDKYRISPQDFRSKARSRRYG
ncbi:response regulator [Paenibacillus lycopersici]|uniref:Response regulator n=1 Tax=Paenibacillus lycopersici TaxID=2704462 RepID=A0A6C0FUM5_9BACL|nr:response regulator [Paenibacillus lycopersici]QHT60858.1 response regulator [Paenibacillus lycopersici]